MSGSCCGSAAPPPTGSQDPERPERRSRSGCGAPGPGVENEKIGVIYKDQEYKKVTAAGYWYQIELEPGKYGWVHHKYVKEVLK